MASVASVPSSMSASVAMSAVTADKVDTSAIFGPASGTPVVALKPRTVPALVALSGSSIEPAASLSCRRSERSTASLRSANCAVILSSSVFSEPI